MSCFVFSLIESRSSVNESEDYERIFIVGLSYYLVSFSFGDIGGPVDALSIAAYSFS